MRLVRSVALLLAAVVVAASCVGVGEAVWLRARVVDRLMVPPVQTNGGDGVAPDNGQPAGSGKPSYVLPLASPLNKPEVTYIPPWSFGSEKWDPVAGAAGSFGPKGDLSDATLQPGQTVPFPPGTPPDMNPNMYIQPAPSGVVPSQLELHEDFEVNRPREPAGVEAQGSLNGHPVFSPNVKPENLQQ